MLHKADAAFLTQAGRCYLQVGNDEIYELFQSGFSGAPYTEGGDRISSAVALISRSGKTDLVGTRKRAGEKNTPIKGGKEETQLDAVIRYLNKCALDGGYQTSSHLWLYEDLGQRDRAREEARRALEIINTRTGVLNSQESEAVDRLRSISR